MSTPPTQGGTASSAKRRGWLMTGAGVVLTGAVFAATNWFFSLSSANFDFTEHKVHTLSAGTENILKRVDTDVTVKLFVSPVDDLPPQFRPAIGQVEGWLQRYHEMRPDFVKVQKFVVEPASDEEQAAATAGVQPQQGRFYFGIAITCLDKTTVIPWVPALLAPFIDQDRIEFALSAGITEVIAVKKKSIGVMSAHQLAGNQMPFGGRNSPPWAFYDELQRLYDVKTIELGTTKIDPSLEVLLLVHPAGITDEAQYAVDQYLLGGGHVIAFLDGYSYIASQSGGQQPGMPPGMGPGAVPTGSNLPKLLAAWGYNMESDHIVADAGFATQMQGATPNPLLLTLATDGVKHSTDVTKGLNDFFMIFAGAMTGEPASADIKATPLLTTSPKNQMVDNSYAATPGGPAGQKQIQRLMDNFRSDGKERLLAVELTGKFKTAFPEGKPAPPPPAPAGGAGAGGLPPGLNFGGPQGAQGEPGTEAAAPQTPAAPPAPAPAEAPKPAEPAAAAPAPASEAAPAPAAPEAAPPAVAAPELLPPPAGTPAPAAPAPGAPAAPVAPVAPSADPDAPAPLKESAKEGMVVLVSDTDMLADFIHPMILQNSNLPFALNVIDAAAGDRDLMSIRSRGSARRPFATLNNIREAASERIKGDIELMNKEVEKLNTDIAAQTSRQGVAQVLTAGLREMQVKEAELKKRIYEKQKEANKEVKSKENFMRWINILVAPLIIAGIGLIVLVLRKAQTSAR